MATAEYTRLMTNISNLCVVRDGVIVVSEWGQTIASNFVNTEWATDRRADNSITGCFDFVSQKDMEVLESRKSYIPKPIFDLLKGADDSGFVNDIRGIERPFLRYRSNEDANNALSKAINEFVRRKTPAKVEMKAVMNADGGSDEG